MHVASFPYLVNPFFVYDYHTIPPLPSRTKVTYVLTSSLQSPYCAFVLGLFRSNTLSSQMETAFQLSRIIRPTLAVPSMVSENFNFAQYTSYLSVNYTTRNDTLILHHALLIRSYW